ncbi:MAG: ATP-binding protein [Acidobacteriota bacterium]
MRLDFMDRTEEARRLKRAFASRDGTFCCLHGRRRCGKSRLLQETLPARRSVYYVADESEPALQRAALARAVSPMLPGFEQVAYPDWNSLLDRWLRDAPPGSLLALDEFPYLANASPELPSILQKTVDRAAGKGLHLVLCGSSQRMMQGLVLDASAPLYGRAREIIHVTPLEAGWVSEALKCKSPVDALSAFAVWGGVPRYWELAADFEATWPAVRDLVLDPAGVLHDEPRRLLLDDIRDTAQASSIMALIGQGCHRLSEIAGRIGKPATSLSRPLQRLIELGFVRRECPFGLSEKNTKRTVYRIADPFLLFWFRYVQPNRSRLEAREAIRIQEVIANSFGQHVGGVWEDLARAAVPRMVIAGREWTSPQRWWGFDTNGKELECDVVARSTDGKALLVGEAKMDLSPKTVDMTLENLRRKAERLPPAKSFDVIVSVIFTAGKNRPRTDAGVISVGDVLAALR